MIVWPGVGARSKAPKAVRTTEGRLRSVATAGRSVKMVSPFRSRPTVMLNGRVEVATSMGLSRRPQRRGNRPAPCGVASRFPERVRAVERDLGIDPRGQAGHELILLKDAARLIKVDGSDAGCRDAPDRSNGTRAQAVPASRMEVVDR